MIMSSSGNDLTFVSLSEEGPQKEFHFGRNTITKSIESEEVGGGSGSSANLDSVTVGDKTELHLTSHVTASPSSDIAVQNHNDSIMNPNLNDDSIDHVVTVNGGTTSNGNHPVDSYIINYKTSQLYPPGSKFTTNSNATSSKGPLGLSSLSESSMLQPKIWLLAACVVFTLASFLSVAVVAQHHQWGPWSPVTSKNNLSGKESSTSEVQHKITILQGVKNIFMGREEIDSDSDSDSDEEIGENNEVGSDHGGSGSGAKGGGGGLTNSTLHGNADGNIDKSTEKSVATGQNITLNDDTNATTVKSYVNNLTAKVQGKLAKKVQLSGGPADSPDSNVNVKNDSDSATVKHNDAWQRMVTHKLKTESQSGSPSTKTKTISNWERLVGNSKSLASNSKSDSNSTLSGSKSSSAWKRMVEGKMKLETTSPSITNAWKRMVKGKLNNKNDESESTSGPSWERLVNGISTMNTVDKKNLKSLSKKNLNFLASVDEASDSDEYSPLDVDVEGYDGSDGYNHDHLDHDQDHSYQVPVHSEHLNENLGPSDSSTKLNSQKSISLSSGLKIMVPPNTPTTQSNEFEVVHDHPNSEDSNLSNLDSPSGISTVSTDVGNGTTPVGVFGADHFDLSPPADYYDIHSEVGDHDHHDHDDDQQHLVHSIIDLESQSGSDPDSHSLYGPNGDDHVKFKPSFNLPSEIQLSVNSNNSISPSTNAVTVSNNTTTKFVEVTHKPYTPNFKLPNPTVVTPVTKFFDSIFGTKFKSSTSAANIRSRPPTRTSSTYGTFMGKDSQVKNLNNYIDKLESEVSNLSKSHSNLNSSKKVTKARANAKARTSRKITTDLTLNNIIPDRRTALTQSLGSQNQIAKFKKLNTSSSMTNAASNVEDDDNVILNNNIDHDKMMINKKYDNYDIDWDDLAKGLEQYHKNTESSVPNDHDANDITTELNHEGPSNEFSSTSSSFSNTLAPLVSSTTTTWNV